MRQSDAGSLGEALQANLAKFGMLVGGWRLGGRIDRSDGAGPLGPSPGGEPGRGRDAEVAQTPGAMMHRKGLGSAKPVSSSELGIIIITAAAVAAVSVFMALVSAP